MGVRFYDEALVNKIGKWIKDPTLRLLKPEESSRLFEMAMDVKKDKILTLPLISLTRNKSIEILNTQKQRKTFNGYNLGLNQEVNIPLNVIPIQLGYQIDIYTKGMIEADEYVRNFVFNLINYPKLEVTIPYNNVNLHHESIIELSSSIDDNSDIKEHLFADQFVRFTLTLTISDAYLFSAPTNPTAKFELAEFNVYDKDLHQIVETDTIDFPQN